MKLKPKSNQHNHLLLQFLICRYFVGGVDHKFAFSMSNNLKVLGKLIQSIAHIRLVFTRSASFGNTSYSLTQNVTAPHFIISTAFSEPLYFYFLIVLAGSACSVCLLCAFSLFLAGLATASTPKKKPSPHSVLLSKRNGVERMKHSIDRSRSLNENCLPIYHSPSRMMQMRSSVDT